MSCGHPAPAPEAALFEHKVGTPLIPAFENIFTIFGIYIVFFCFGVWSLYGTS